MPAKRPNFKQYGCTMLLRQDHAVGQQIWATALFVSKNGTKIIRDLPPTLIEFCAAPTRSEDKRRRQLWNERLNGPCKNIDCIVPVNPNGTLDYNHYSLPDVCFCETEQDARQTYDYLRTQAVAQCQKAQKTIQKVIRRLQNAKQE